MSAERVFCTEPHDYGPADPPAWQVWAQSMAQTHEQHECPDCGLPVLWRERQTTPTPPTTEGLLW